MVSEPINNGHDCNQSAAMSYKLLRTMVGFLGMGLPILVVSGAFLFDGVGFQGSISAYYHTGMRDVFVGILFITAAFLFTYNPEDYPDGYIDNIAAYIAGICALGIALFPADLRKTICIANSCNISNNCTIEGVCPIIQVFNLSIDINTLHTAFSVGFFVVLTVFSLFLFTKSKEKPGAGWTPKRIRNAIYIACGTIMAVALILISIFYFLRCCYPGLQDLNPVFWLESVALLAFGFSWLTKGEFFFADKPSNPK